MGINTRFKQANGATVVTPSAPTAPVAYVVEAAGAVAVVSNAATDLDTAQAALLVLRDEVATLTTDVATLTTAVTAIIADNVSMRAAIND